MPVPALYWRTVNLASEAIESDNDVWNVIKQQMQAVGLADVKKNQSDVNGHTQDTIVATTFVKLGKKSYAIFITAAGDHAKTLRDKVGKNLESVKFL